MALLSDREAFDKAAMRKVEEGFLKEVMETAKDAPGSGVLMVTETCWEKLDCALQAARRYTKDENKYTRQSAQRAVSITESPSQRGAFTFQDSRKFREFPSLR